MKAGKNSWGHAFSLKNNHQTPRLLPELLLIVDEQQGGSAPSGKLIRAGGVRCNDFQILPGLVEKQIPRFSDIDFPEKGDIEIGRNAILISEKLLKWIDFYENTL